ncbi:hypothetical protein KAU33_13475 [Candidatus Dependentiae bacterium]|nr:hypothetical protein [Candidatus Dependentiae bacterium]
MKKKILFSLIIIIFLSCSFSKFGEINQSIKENIKSSKFGIRIDIQIFNNKLEPASFSKVIIEMEDKKRIVIFTDNNGKLSIGFNKTFYEKNKPKIRFKSNFGNEKLKIKYKIKNELKYQNQNIYEEEESLFLCQILNFTKEDLENKEKEITLEPLILDFANKFRNWGHLNEQIDFFFKVNSPLKEKATFLIINEDKDYGKEIFQIFSDKDHYFRLYVNKEYDLSNPEYIIFSKNLDKKRPYDFITNMGISHSTQEKTGSFHINKNIAKLLTFLFPKLFKVSKIEYFYIKNPYKDLLKGESEYFIAYFHKEEKKKTERILNNIENDIKIINEHFHLKIGFPKKQNVLFVKDENNKYYIIPKEARFRGNIVQADEEKSRYFLIHETVEVYVTIFYLKNVYKNDKYTRWIGDGLARYMEFYVFKKINKKKSFFSKKHFFGLVEISESNFCNSQDIFKNKKFDLKKFEMYSMKDYGIISMQDAYIVAMYFWYKITNKCGDQVIDQFLDEASRLDKPTNKELIPLLSKITDMDIDKELNVNLEEVVDFVNNN